MSIHEQNADVLDGAADVIERDGWHQGSAVNHDTGARCAMNALSAVPHKGVSGVKWLTSVRVAAKALKAHLGINRIAPWNDAPERTKQEVLDALRLAAKSERRLADGIES